MHSWRSSRPKGKYRNEKVVVDNVEFDSKREAKRYDELKIMQHAGLISDLQLQFPLHLEVCGRHICTYIADFRYFDREKGVMVHEDSKGVRTQVYLLKKKLVHAILDIVIKET